MRESLRYYFVRAGLFAMYMSLRVRIMLGLHYDAEALEDFDLDVTHHPENILEVEKDSLMGLAIKKKVIN